MCYRPSLSIRDVRQHVEVRQRATDGVGMAFVSLGWLVRSLACAVGWIQGPSSWRAAGNSQALPAESFRPTHHRLGGRTGNKNFLQPCDFGSAQLNLVKFRNSATSCITTPRRPIFPPPQKSISRENGFLEGSRQARQGHPSPRQNRYAPPEKVTPQPSQMLMCSKSRFSWWRHPGARRVYGRHHPFHHQERQGPWYAPHFPGFVDQQLILHVCPVREDDILVLLESEREARRLR